MHKRDIIVRSCSSLKNVVEILRRIPSSIESIIILNPPIDKAKAVGELIDHFVGGSVSPAMTSHPAHIVPGLEPNL